MQQEAAPGLLLLSNEDVAHSLSFEAAISAVEDGFRQLWHGTANVMLS